MKNNKNNVKTFVTAIVILASVAFLSVFTALKFQEPVSYSEDAVFYYDLWVTTTNTESLPYEATITEEIQTEKELVSETDRDNSASSVSQMQASESDIAYANTNDTVANSKTDTITKQVEQSGLININTATVEELQQLNGIGPVIAERIFDYARTSGFKSINEIKNVKGIGEKKFEAIKDKITV